MKIITLALSLFCLLLVGCGSANKNSSDTNTDQQLGSSNQDTTNDDQHAKEMKTFLIGHALVDCVGVIPMKCMVVNGEYFYDVIKGFHYEEGYHYNLKVELTHLPKHLVPADASSISYKLITQVSKVAVN